MGFLALLLWEYTQYPLPFGKRRSMRRKLVILFVAVFTSIFGGAACGGEADV
jgi:cell division protein FtsB